METVATVNAGSPARPGRGRVKLGWGVFALTSAAAVAGLALDVQSGSYKTLFYLGVNVVLALIALLLTTRRPEHPISWILAITALWGAIGGLTYAYAIEALVADPGSLPGGLAAAWFDNWWWLPGLALPLSALLVLMPDGHLASRRWWPVPTAVVVGTVLGSVAVSASPTFDLGTATPIENPLARVGGSAVAVVGIVGVILVIVGLVASLAAFVVRYRSSGGDVRQQLRWVGVSLGLAVSLFVIGALLWGVVPGAEVLPVLAVLALPAGIAVAVLKYRLYEVDRIVSRTLIYGALTVVLGAAYAILVLAGQWAFASFAGGSNLAIAVSTLVVAALFLPLRRRIQRVVDRRFYRRRYDAQRTLEAFGSRLREQVELEKLTADLCGVVEESMQPAHVSLWLRAELGR